MMFKLFGLSILVFLVGVTSVLGGETDPDTDEVARYWNGDALDSNDLSGYGNDLTEVNTPTWENVTIGAITTNAIHFEDGNSETAYTASKALTGISEGVTISAWVHLDSFTTADYMFGYSCCDAKGYSIEFHNNGGNGVLLREDATVRYNSGQAIIPPTGSWHHVFMEFNSTDATYWYDNILNGSGSSTTPTEPTNNFYVASANGVSQYSDVDMYCLRVINGTLTQSMRDLIYNGGDADCTSLSALVNPPNIEVELTVNAVDFYDGSTINNFTITLENGTHTLTNSTTSSQVRFSPLANNTFYNITISSNNSGGYFNATDFNYNITNQETTTVRPYQTIANFNASQIYTNLGISNLNLSTPNQPNVSVNGLVTLYLKAGDYTIIGSAENHLNRSFAYTATALANSTTNLLFGNSVANLTLFDALNNVTVTDGFNLTITPLNLTTNYTDDTGTALLTDIPLVLGYDYSFSVVPNEVSSFENGLKNFTATLTYENWSMFVQTIHSVNLQIFNEMTKELLTENVTVTFIGSSAVNFTTENGTLFVGNLTPDNYELKYSSSNFPQRSYFFSLPTGGSDDFDLFLLDSSNATEVKISVKDQNFDNVENATIQALRYYTDTNSYEIIGMAKTAFDGTNIFNLKLNEPNYKFRVLTEDKVRLTTIGSIITTVHSTNGLNFQINTETSTLQDVEDLLGVQANISYDSSNALFTFAVNDVSNTVDITCLEINQLKNGAYEVVNISCTTSASPSVQLGFDNSTGGWYTAVGKLYTTSDDGSQVMVIADEKSTFSDVNNVIGTLGNVGLFIIAILVMGIALTRIDNPTSAIMTGSIAFIVPILFGFTVFSLSAALGIFVLGIIISATMTTRPE